MAFWKRRSRNFEPVSAQTRYTVTYLGHEEMRGKVGLDNTLKPVDDLYKQYKLKKVKAPSRMQIEVVNNGIRVEPLDAGVRTMFANSPYFVAEGPFGNVFFPINKLSFGAADPLHTKVFCFVSRNDSPSQDGYWDCHAVICDSSAMARNLTLDLVKAFQRIADSKDDPIASAQKSKKTTTVHILRERGTLEHQLVSKRKGKRPPVSTIKVTLNVEVKTNSEQMVGDKQLDNNTNRKVADILAKQRSIDFSDFEDRMLPSGNEEVKTNENNVPKGVTTSSSDKENDIVVDMVDDVEESNGTPREITVTVAVNPDLSSPPGSPRKSPSPQGQTASSGEDDDVAFMVDASDGNTSPQEMITTMSPPDTPGYLSKDGKSPSPTIPDMPTKPPSPRKPVSASGVDLRRKAPAPSSPTQNACASDISPRKKDNTDSDALVQKSASPSSPQKTVTTPPPSPPHLENTSDVGLKREAPSPSSPQRSKGIHNTNALKKEGVDTSGVLRRKSPSPENPPHPPRQSPIPSTANPTTDDVAAAEKKQKKEKRKSVRFAVDDELIG